MVVVLMGNRHFYIVPPHLAPQLLPSSAHSERYINSGEGREGTLPLLLLGDAHVPTDPKLDILRRTLFILIARTLANQMPCELLGIGYL